MENPAVSQRHQNDVRNGLRERLPALKSRLDRYHTRYTAVRAKEAEFELAAKLAKQRREDQDKRLEAEKQILLQELRAQAARDLVAAQNPAPPPHPPVVNMSMFDQGFGFPGMITEQQAINWLRAGTQQNKKT